MTFNYNQELNYDLPSMDDFIFTCCDLLLLENNAFCVYAIGGPKLSRPTFFIDTSRCLFLET